MNEVSLVINGFETVEQALAFANWYSGQGEQDSSIWFENCDDLDDVHTMNCDSISVTTDMVYMKLKLFKD